MTETTPRQTPTAPAPFTAPPLTINDSVRYQGASGDYNPIHHDSNFAQSAGHPEPFAVGMRQAGILAGFATDWLGVENIRRFKVRFLEKAWPGDILTYSAEIAEVRDGTDTTAVDVDLFASFADGRRHLRAWATFEVPVAG